MWTCPTSPTRSAPPIDTRIDVPLYCCSGKCTHISDVEGCGPCRTIMAGTHYTHGYGDTVLANHRGRTAHNSAGYLLPYLNKQQHLLDIGSGAGTITVGFVELVQHVTALEVSDEALDVTRKEAQRQNVSMDFAVGDIHRLPFPDNTFDVVHVHQVLQHVGERVEAMKEMRRVVKPGGIVACRESVYSAFTGYPSSQGLESWKKLYIDTVRSNGGEPDAGAMLLDWALQAGFTDITPGIYTWCFATPETRQHWGGLWEKRILHSALADQARSQGTTDEELERISRAWATWKETPCGWYMVPHSHILARK